MAAYYRIMPVDMTTITNQLCIHTDLFDNPVDFTRKHDLEIRTMRPAKGRSANDPTRNLTLDVLTYKGIKVKLAKAAGNPLAHKTLLMMMISYNLLRNLMQRSAAHAQKPLVEMSFKGTLDAVNTSHPLFRGLGSQHRKRARLREEVIAICATKILDVRPFRQEPRAIKRRPKPFQYLTAPRHVFREIHHKEKYRKAA